MILIIPMYFASATVTYNGLSVLLSHKVHPPSSCQTLMGMDKDICKLKHTTCRMKKKERKSEHVQISLLVAQLDKSKPLQILTQSSAEKKEEVILYLFIK